MFMVASKGVKARAEAISIVICYQRMLLFSAHIVGVCQSASLISDHYPTPGL